MTSTNATQTQSLERNVVIVLDVEHAHKNSTETLFSSLSRSSDAGAKLLNLWVVRSNKPTAFAKIPMNGNMWGLMACFQEARFPDELNKGRSASNSTSQYIRGYYSGAAGNVLQTISKVIVVTNRVSSFTDEAFYLGENVNVHMVSTPEQVENALSSVFTVESLPEVAAPSSPTREQQAPQQNEAPKSGKGARKPAVSGKKRKTSDVVEGQSAVAVGSA
jgi:hypothetical protein